VDTEEVVKNDKDTQLLERQIAELKEEMAKLKAKGDKGSSQKGPSAPKSQPATSARKRDSYSEGAGADSAAASGNTASSPGAEGGPVCNHMSPNFDS